MIGLTFKHNVSTKFIAVSVKTFELAIFPPSSLHVQNCLTVNHPCKSCDCYWIKYPIITDRLTLNKLLNYIKFCLRFAKTDCNSTLTRLHNVKEITTAPILMVNTSAMINQEPTIFEEEVLVAKQKKMSDVKIHTHSKLLFSRYPNQQSGFNLSNTVTDPQD